MTPSDSELRIMAVVGGLLTTSDNEEQMKRTVVKDMLFADREFESIDAVLAGITDDLMAAIGVVLHLLATASALIEPDAPGATPSEMWQFYLKGRYLT